MRDVDPTSALDLSLPSGGGAAPSGGSFGGGSFGGGGASATVDEAHGHAASLLTLPAPSAATSSSSAGSRANVDFRDLDELLVVLLALAALLLAIFGGGVYLVYEAPAILGEAAFNALLAAGLVRRTRALGHPDWAGSVFRATWKPFGVVLVVAAVAGWAMHLYVPEAPRVLDVVRISIGRS